MLKQFPVGVHCQGKKMYKSEAQAYQMWRRDVKKMMRDAQRHQNYSMWIVLYETRHPAIQKQVSKIMGQYNIKMPAVDKREAQLKAIEYQDIASQCHLLLNRYKVTQ